MGATIDNFSNAGTTPRAATLPPKLRIGTVPTKRPNVQNQIRNSLIMMVDDEPINTEVIQTLLEDQGYERFVSTSDSQQAVKMAILEQPDVLLLDLMMPVVTGFDILSVMRASNELQHIPTLVLTSSNDAESKLKALQLGASDLLGKPVDPSELALRLNNVLEAKAYQDYLTNHSALLEHEVRLRTEQLDAAHRQIIYCLARASEFRDDDTGKHVVRVGRYSELIARSLGCDDDFCDQIRVAAQLHDVGKIGIPDSILLKPERLDEQEYALMKGHCDLGTSILNAQEQADLKVMARHTEIGARIMESIPDSSIMRMATTIAATHHERWDGTGYPHKLKGEEIPIEGRITAVADVYDALSSKRPYKDVWPAEKCFEILRDERGKHFDPQIIDAFFLVADQFARIQAELADRD